MSIPFSAPVRFAIVGCGTIAPTHAEAIRTLEAQGANVALVAVCDTVIDRAATLAQTFGVAKVYTNEANLFADPDIDAVCLCTPSGLHMEAAIAAMNAGKHVLSEKPMDVSVAVCDGAIAVSEATGKMLSVVSQHRFDPATISAKAAIDAGLLGKIVLANAAVPWFRTQSYYDSGDWRGTWAMDGGGATINQGVHTVDVLLYLAGDVQTVSAFYTVGAAHERIEVEDVLTASLRFGSGAIGTLYATTAAYPGFPTRIEIFGTEGTAIIEGDALKVLHTKSGGAQTGEVAASHAQLVAQGGTAAARAEAVWGDSHRAQIMGFAQAIRTGTKPAIDGFEGRRPLRLIDAMYRSARAGFAVNL
ncbi:MAG: Gfo/Idh/MocA family oxidoreductase [Armatimonadetes bacterium]|nr:Gfo/Idh/MocA family oxidoreductase [Armatimonadota bacterium]